MRKTSYSLIFLTILLFVLASCAKEEELPTAVPTTVVPTTAPTHTAVASQPQSTVETSQPTQPATTGVATIDPADINWSPQLLASNPLPGAEIAPTGAITLRFDQPMDQASVEAALQLTAVDDDTPVAGNYSWPAADTVTFTPQTTLQSKQQYRVLLSEQAQGQNGRALQTPIDILLQTASPLTVSQTIPEDGTTQLQTDSAITVIFNHPVVPLVSSGQQADLPQPLTFEPAATGQGNWISTSIYRFVPDPPFAGATTYDVTVDPALTDLLGLSLDTATSWQFSTVGPQVASVLPLSETPIAPDGTFTVTFNMPMDTASTEAAISLVGDTAVALTYNWTEDGQAVGITPTDLLTLNTNYELAIANTAQSANGPASLTETPSIVFRTLPYPAVSSTYPRAGETTGMYDRGVNIQFNTPMDWDTLEDKITILPEPQNLRYFIDTYSNGVNLDFSYQPDTNYRVIVPASAADPYGNSLGNAYELTFRTPGLPPVASFNLLPNQNVLSNLRPTDIEIVHSNVDTVDIALYDVGLPVNLLTRPYDIANYTPVGNPLRQWQLPLDGPRNEYSQTTLSLADGRTLPLGIYLLHLSSPQIADDVLWWQNQRNLLVVSDTNVVVKEMFGAVHVWVTDINTGEPVTGRNLTLYSPQSVQLATAVSDANGFARFEYTPDNNYLEGVTVLSNAPGETGFGVGNSVWNGRTSPWQMGVTTDFSDEPSRRAYIYTDRPIYRPGDTVHYKGIVRQAVYGRYDLTAQLDLNIHVYFSGAYEQDPFEGQFSATVRPDGTFSGEYLLPADMPLGNYQFAIDHPDFGFDSYRSFTVAEYRAPEFLVGLTTDQPEALRGETVDVTVQAEYFFGGSAADLPVSWTVNEEPYYPETFDNSYCWTDCGLANYQSLSPIGMMQQSPFVTSGEGVTDANGRLTITLPADLLQARDEGSREVTVEATVTDISNMPVVSRATVIFHAADTYVGIDPVNNFGNAGQELAVELKTVDWTNAVVPNQPVELVFYQREWIPVRTDEYGSYYTLWTVEDTEVARLQVQTDGQGIAEGAFVPETGGTYLVVATTRDTNGRFNLSSNSIWVMDDGRVAWQIDPYDKKMDVVADLSSYEVGQTANVLVQTPFDVPTQAWVTIERGHLLTQYLVTLDPYHHLLQIPITADYAPNAFVTVTAVKPANSDSSSPYADVRVGITELVVPPTLFDLNIELSAQQETVQPGDTAVFDVLVTDANGAPVSADISLSLVDLAVLSLKPDNAPNLLDFFYARQPYRSQIGGSLFIFGEGLLLDLPVAGGGGGGGGGADGAAESIVLRDSEEDDVRQDFRDTAFWQANLQTDDNGRATVEVPLPDNLTTWRLHVKANTADTLVGQNNTDIVSTLPLLIRPVTPRFLTLGDVAEIGAIVNNNTDSPIEAAVSLQASGVTVNGPTEQKVHIPAHGQLLVRWPTAVDAAQFVDGQAFADFTFRVEGGGYQDASKPTLGVGPDQLLPIVRYNAQDITGTSGQLDAVGSLVEAILLPPGADLEQGSVDVQLNASLVGTLLDSLAYYNNLDYLANCPGEGADRLLPNVALAGLIDQLNLSQAAAEYGDQLTAEIERNIALLTGQVHADGGWGWCYEQESSPWLTAYSLLGLAKARQIGYNVDVPLLEKAGNYLVAQLEAPNTFNLAQDANRQAFYLYVLAELRVPVAAELDELVAEARDLLDPYALALVVTAYHVLEIDSDNVPTLLSDLNGRAVVSAAGAHWEDASMDRFNLNSDIRGTAVVLHALAQTDAANPLATAAARWLVEARDTAVWRSNHESAWSLFALTEWLLATGELDTDYEYGLQLNLQPLTDGAFSSQNISQSDLVSVPVADLSPLSPNYFEFRHGQGDGTLYYTVYLHTLIDASQVTAVNRGIHVERAYYDAACDPETETCLPITEIEAGQQVRVVLTIQTENDLLQTIIEDPIPAGTEAVDPSLETTASQPDPIMPLYRPGYWGWQIFNRIEYRDNKVVFLANNLPAGTYQYSYTLNSIVPGQYQVMPTFAKQAYFPDVNGRSDGMLFIISE